MTKAIIFDFDGVIADSNSVKTKAFVELFKGYPEHIKESIRKFHLQNGGMSRFDKFRYIYNTFLKEPLSDERFEELCGSFNRLVIGGVIKAPLFKGVLEFLRKKQGLYDMYIVSGTPQDEIRKITQKRDLDKYFLGVYGSPRSKKELIEDIMGRKNYKPEEVIFLGDSINDYEGAIGAGVEFVGKVFDNLDTDLFSGINLKIKIKTIDEFGRYLERREAMNPVRRFFNAIFSMCRKLFNTDDPKKQNTEHGEPPDSIYPMW
jgi:HAD superfamily hydrolase (TIGR01549 family)